MLAIRFDGARSVLDQRADSPVAGPGEAIIRPRWVALSESDAAPKSQEPVILGHQFVGTVEALHPEADRELRKRWEGKRVVGSPAVVCSRCDLCRAGLAAHCRHRRVLGVQGWDGCLAELFRLPIRNLVEVPAGVDDQAAVFAHMLSGAIHAAQLVRIEGKPYVTILGDSAEALLCAQVMARLNASVRLLGKRQFTICEKWGIKHRDQSEVGRRQDQDIVIDCTGNQGGGWGLSLAMQLARPRGRIVLRPGSETGSRVDLAPLIANEQQVLGARYGSIADAITMLSGGSSGGLGGGASGGLAGGQIDTLSLITRRVRLADGPGMLKLAIDPGQIAVLVEV